ncbi:TPA: hypothetical protein DEP58_02375 [Patescibacteria group bacterium]|nr:MAG: hypothetical protein UU98_C0022G0007 [Parcubacteria group bacterium GW2011_GWD2_42_14]HCC05130.1 hypothetical protein [Patescibacteria group bacterium]
MINVLQERILKLLFILIWMLALIHMTAEYYHLYWTIRWFDILTHFLGGLWVGIAVVWLWYFSGYVRKMYMPDRHTVFVALLGGLLVGLIWELYEYIVWILTDAGLPPGYVGDTLLDLVMDVTGAGVGFLILQQFVFKKPVEAQAQGE